MLMVTKAAERKIFTFLYKDARKEGKVASQVLAFQNSGAILFGKTDLDVGRIRWVATLI